MVTIEALSRLGWLIEHNVLINISGMEHCTHFVPAYEGHGNIKRWLTCVYSAEGDGVCLDCVIEVAREGT